MLATIRLFNGCGAGGVEGEEFRRRFFGYDATVRCDLASAQCHSSISVSFISFIVLIPLANANSPFIHTL